MNLTDFGILLGVVTAILTIIATMLTGLNFLIKKFKNSITEPFNHSMKVLNNTIGGLRDDLNESKISRKEHEKKLFDTTDEHTKQIYSLDGRVKTLETINQIEKEEK